MFDVGDSLRAAIEGARADLHAAQFAVAHASAEGGRAAGGAMAKTAQAAMFTEALLEAARARLAEIKAAAK